MVKILLNVCEMKVSFLIDVAWEGKVRHGCHPDLHPWQGLRVIVDLGHDGLALHPPLEHVLREQSEFHRVLKPYLIAMSCLS